MQVFKFKNFLYMGFKFKNFQYKGVKLKDCLIITVDNNCMEYYFHSLSNFKAELLVNYN